MRMAVRVGLMGFGRIGRNVFRILYKHDNIQIVAISDIADHKGLEYLLKYDTIMGRFPDTVAVTEGHLYTYGRQITMLAGREPGDVDWKALGVDVAVEATAPLPQPGRDAQAPRGGCQAGDLVRATG